MKRLLFVLALLITSCQSYSSDLPQPILVGVGAEAKWSPNETAIAFRRGDSLYVKSLSPDKPAKGIYYASVVSFEWLDDSTIATYEKEYYPVEGGTTRVQRIAKVPLNAPSIEIAKDSLNMNVPGARFTGFQRFSDGSIGYFDNMNIDNLPVRLSAPATNAANQADSSKLNLFLKTQPISWGKVWMCYGNNLNCRQVTHSENYYDRPRLSPTLDKLTCNSMRGDLVVFDTLGNELANLGRTDCASWSPTGDRIVFCVTKEAGDPGDIVASDIYITKWDGSDRRPIANTPDLVEIDPAFSPFRNQVTL
jgi:hypothetical protein